MAARAARVIAAIRKALAATGIIRRLPDAFPDR
jgi:hypothetical protein